MKQRSRVLQAAVARAMRPWWPSMVVASAAVLPLDVSLADDECGLYVGGVELVCDPASNPYSNGIRYPSVTSDIQLRIPTGVTIAVTPGSNRYGADLYGPGTDFAVVLEEGVTIDVSQLNYGGVKLNGSGTQFIQSSASITAASVGLRADINDLMSAASITISQLQPGSITITEDDGAAGLYGETVGSGDVSVTSAGHVASSGFRVSGLYAGAVDGTATTVLTETGTVSLNADWTTGLFSLASGAGLVRAVSAGTIDVTGTDSAGLVAYGIAGSTGDSEVELTGTGSVNMNGERAYGLWALQLGSGNAHAQSSGVITTQGQQAHGMYVLIDDGASTATASATVNGGSITTSGELAHALSLESSSTGAATIQLLSNAQLTTNGVDAYGVGATAIGSLSLTQSQASIVSANGAGAVGVSLSSDQDVTALLNGAVRAPGEYGVGVASTGTTGTAQVTIESTATVTGGWQADIVGTGATTGVPATGVWIQSDNVARLINRGTITAGSDRAIFTAGTGAATVDNFSTLTGFVEFASSGANVFNNASTFALRHFADTDGDGARDTKRVAISDFGAATSVFNNTSGAIVKLAEVASAAATDATSYYLPTTGVDSRALDGTVYSLTRAGVVQGQLVNLGMFNHGGAIDLRGPQTGNTLVITGAASAGGAPGSGVFVSNGGTLFLNVVLNEGIAPGGQSGSIADVLVVDGTQMGSGATTITLDRKEGAGAVTPGNGILLVEVRDKARSAADVFALNGDYMHNGLPSVVVGAYAYSLFHNGAGSDAGDGNWYLRSSVRDLEPTDPTDPSDPQDPADPVTPPDPGSPPPPAAPRFQPGVPLYESYAMNLQALNMLPTLQQRVGNRVWGGAVSEESTGVWGRTYGASSRARTVTSPAAAEHSVDAWKMQLGLDHLAVTSDKGNRLVASLAVEYGQADSSIRSIFGDGKLDTDSYGVGAMWTWYRHTGLYVDVQAQVNRYSSDLQSALLGQLVRDNDGHGEAFSIELGKAVALGDEWSITPQAQLSYSNVRFDPFVDPSDALVSTHDADSRITRAGIAVNRDYEVHERRNHWYGIANLSYEWGNGLHVNVSGAQLRRMDRRSWGEIGLGGSINWNNGVRLYGEVSGKSPLRDIGDSYTFHGTVGLSVQF